MSDLSTTRVHRPAGQALTGRLIRLAIVTIALALVAIQLAGVDAGPPALGPLLGGLVGLLVLFLLSTILMLVRARTQVGPDGIHNRVLGGETHLRWEDLSDVRVTTRHLMRTVQVVRRDGRVVRLTALRDAPTMPDPGFDETVEVIRRQIANHRVGEPAAREPAPES
ncbi:MAG TPA: PH domain-containing protein [Euzebyales bacterium]|nr:PH domain-containing protein [Euzebyales bacterium]